MSDDFDADRWAAELSPDQLRIWTSAAAREASDLRELSAVTGRPFQQLVDEADFVGESEESYFALLHFRISDDPEYAVSRRAAQRRVAEESGDGFYGNPFTLQDAPAGLPREVRDGFEQIDFATVEEAARYSARTFANPDDPAYRSDDVWVEIWVGEASGVLLYALIEELLLDGIERLASIPEHIGPYGDGGDLSLPFVDDLFSSMIVAEQNDCGYPETITELTTPLTSVHGRLNKPDRHEFFADAFALSREERRVWMRLNAEHAHKPYNFPAKVRPKPRP